MSFFPKEPLFLAIELTSDSFKIAGIKKKKNGWVFPILQEVSYEQLKGILSKEANVIVSLPSKEILIKNLSLPLKGEKEIAQAFDFQVEPILPYPIEKCITQYIKIEEKEHGCTLSVFSVKKEALARLLEHCEKNLSLEPDVVSAPALAIASLASLMPPIEDPFFFVHIGQEEGVCVLIEKGKLITARHFEKEKTELEKAFLAISRAYKNKKIESYFLICEDKIWETTMQEITGKAPLCPSFPTLPLSEEKLRKYGLAIGLALSGALNGPNFRQKEFRRKLSWKRLKKPLITQFVLISSLFLSLFFLEKECLERKKDQVIQKYISLFGEEGAALTTLPQLEEKLLLLEKKYEQTPNLFPLAPQIPKVSDVISYLSMQLPSSIKIEDFRYRLVKRPEFDKPSEPYLVQIEMSFLAENSSVAESAKNILQTPNPFIDAKKEISWEINNRGIYKTCFYLKDKTQYR